MIQELLGGAGLLAGESKIPINGSGGNIAAKSCPSLPTSPSPSPSLASSNVASTAATATSSNSENQNLRCPRCDSSNTKFCYYNNYNLTQPRHFCKTCRRYWTKGGALRNVPIGGGCRKNKNANVSSSVAKASAARMKTVVSEIGRSGLAGTIDQDFPVPSSPILWGSPQNSHLLALLRSGQNANPSPSPISSAAIVKDEGNMIGTHMTTDDQPLVANGVISGRIPGSDFLGQPPSLGLCSSSLWRNSQYQRHQHTGNFMSELPNDGLQELYQRLRSSSTNYCANSSPLFHNNSVMASSSFFESAPITGSELGYGSLMSWSDIPTGHD